MFRQLRKVNNESGIVLFIVLMTAIIIMIISVGVLTQSMNQTQYAQNEIDQTTCDQLKKGIFWNAQSAGTLATGTFIYNGAAFMSRIYTITTSSSTGAQYNTWQVTCTPS